MCGCAGSSIYTRRETVSRDLAGRTGFGIRTTSENSHVLPPGTEWKDGISDDEAVAIGLWNNAAFGENLSRLGLARADLAQAGLLANPSLSILFPVGPKQLEFAATLPVEALWLRPVRLRIAALDAERVAQSLVQSGLDLVRDVRWALSDLLLARDKATLAEQTLGLRERAAWISAGLERAGEGTEASVLAADADAAAALAAKRTTEADVVLAEERLLALLGLSELEPHAVFAPSRAVSLLAPPLHELERIALAMRPDLRAAELAMEAAGERAGLAEAEIFTLSVIADANAKGDKGFEIGPGLALAIPIFNQNQGGRTRADAELERSAWAYLGTRQRIIGEIRQALERFVQASRAFELQSASVVPKLQEVVTRSQRAYQTADLSPLELQYNSQQLVAARLREAELAAERRRSWADLERSVGASPERGKEAVIP